MAIQTNLAGCGPAGTETAGAIIIDQLGVYYVVTDAGTFEIPAELAEALNAVITYPRAPVTISAENLGDPLLNLTTVASGSDILDVHLQHKVTTTDATPALIAAIPIGGGSDIVLTYSGLLTARRTGGAAGAANDGAGYRVEFVARGTSGPTATLIGSSVTVIGEDQAGWDIQVAANGGNVEIKVVGAANNNISWFISGHWVNAGV